MPRWHEAQYPESWQAVQDFRSPSAACPWICTQRPAWWLAGGCFVWQLWQKLVGWQTRQESEERRASAEWVFGHSAVCEVGRPWVWQSRQN